MSKLVHIGLQLLATVAQVAPLAAGVVTPKWGALIVALGSVAQAALALANHSNGAAPAK